jgi:expansin (peptidoglycan-binding protein)
LKPSRILSGLFFLAFFLALGGAGCQSVLGIHDGKTSSGGASQPGSGGTAGVGPVHDAAMSDLAAMGGAGGRTTDASGDRDGMESGTGGAGGVGGAPSSPDADGGGVGGTSGSDAATMDAPDDHGGVETGSSDGGGDLGLQDAPAMDAKPGDIVSADGANDGSSDAPRPDGGACAAAWQATNVAARILTPNTGGSTACSIAGTAVPTLAAGVDATNFRGAAACGACLRVKSTTSSATVVVPVVEQSGAAGILLTRAAMDQLVTGADLINVDWTLVPCEVGTEPVRYFIKEGTNAGYLGVQVRNARYPLASVSVVTTSTTIPLTLQSYNYWESTSAGAGPLTLRLTDINGQRFDEPGVKLTPLTEFVGQGQFPLCH